MTENEFLLEDRIAKIKATVEKYGEDNFRISYSGGKDSNVLSALVDMALPKNRIPRVYANTGIELNMVRDFVFEQQKHDDRIQVIKPSVPIKKMLEEEGYPFKSKHHSLHVKRYQMCGKEYKSVRAYLGEEPTVSWGPRYTCPNILRYQFDPTYRLRISDVCCVAMKEKPMTEWAKENNKPYTMIGLMREEGGRRSNANCLAFKGKKFFAFQPLAVVTKPWENWFIEKRKVDIPALYYPPFNFVRTGCKGCPFAQDLQEELDTLEKFFPNERKQCEIIWKPVYDEYRRLGYRLKKPYENDHVEGQLAFTDIDMTIGTE